MNNKRSCYQPSFDEKSLIHDKRKTLAQGRLIQDKIIDEDTNNTASQLASTNKEARAASDSDTSILRGSNADLLVGQPKDPSTPRKMRPQASFTQSPRAMQPSRALDVSDTDSEVVPNFRSQVTEYPEQVELDPSHAIKISNFKTKDGSTPSKKKKAPRFVASRYMQAKPAAAKAAGDRSALTQSAVGSKSLNTTNRKAVNSSTLLPNRTAPSSNEINLKPKRTCPVNAASSESIRIGSSAPLKPKRSGTSFHLQPKRTGSSAPVQQKRTSTSAPLQSKRTGSSIPLQPKQTGGHVMGSVSLEPKSTCLIEKPARNNKTSHHSKATATRTPKEKERSGGGKASTPTMESTRPEPEAVDISAIGPSKLHYHNSFNSPTLDDTALSSRMRMGSTWSGSHASSKHGLQTFDMSSAFSHDSATDPSRTKARQTTQLQLDAHYARYLQWLFLRTSLTHSQHQQQRHCMNEASTLWEETERGRARQTELEGQLTNIQHANRLDAALLLQVAGLSSVSEQLGELKRQYNHLAAALDTTRHQIPTKSVHIPKDEQHFQDRLSEALTETEGLLHELSTFTSARTPGVVRLSESLHVVHDAAHSQVVQLHRCYELLAAADSLNTRESSLRIQQLQAQVPLSSDKLYG